MYYSGNEIVEISISIEENGYAFYTEAAKNVEEQEMKNLFLDLASKEISHIGAFQKIGEVFKDQYIIDAPEDAELYIQNLADKHIFKNKNAGIEKAKGLKNADEILRIALQFELESIDFYSSMLDRVSGNAKRIIQNIIEEEKEHASEIRSHIR